MNQEDSDFAKCTACSAKVKRGKSVRDYSTKPLISHLRLYHTDQYNECNQKPSTNATCSTKIGMNSPKQPTILQAIDSTKQWPIEHSKSKEIHRKIGEMIALDSQPFSIVNDSGFIGLLNHLEPKYKLPSRSYFSENVILSIYQEVRGKMKLMIG